MAQPRLPGTLPSPAEARKNHRATVAAERAAQATVDELRAALADAKRALKKAGTARQTAEDDLDAIDEGRRPEGK